jgi:hypothetical protein
MSFEPSIFMRSPHGFDGRITRRTTGAQSQTDDTGRTGRRLDQELGEVAGANGAYSECITAGVIESDERALEIIWIVEPRPIGPVAHETEPEFREPEAQMSGAVKVRGEGGFAMPPALGSGSLPHSPSNREA